MVFGRSCQQGRCIACFLQAGETGLQPSRGSERRFFSLSSSGMEAFASSAWRSRCVADSKTCCAMSCVARSPQNKKCEPPSAATGNALQALFDRTFEAGPLIGGAHWALDKWRSNIVFPSSPPIARARAAENGSNRGCQDPGYFSMTSRIPVHVVAREIERFAVC